MGTAVFGGMAMATLLTVLFVPVFFSVFQRGGERYFSETIGVGSAPPPAEGAAKPEPGPGAEPTQA